jgi:hypothetical protein
LSNAIKKILKAATTTQDLQAGGYLNRRQAAKFIKMIIETSLLLKIIRCKTMTAPKMELDKIGVGKRIMRGMGENEDMSPYTKKPIFGKVDLDAVKYATPYEISEDAIEDNIEGKALEGLIAGLITSQMSLDIEDLAVNGNKVYPDDSPLQTTLTGAINTDEGINIVLADTTGFPKDCNSGCIKIDDELIAYESINYAANTLENCTRGVTGTTVSSHTDTSVVNWIRDPLMGVDDGWLSKCYKGNAHFVDLASINSGVISKTHFFKLFRALPKKYRGAKKGQLRWFMSSHQKSLWDEYLTNRTTSAGDSVIAGNSVKPLGIPIVEVASWPDDAVMLTYPKNLIWGIYRLIKSRKTTTAKDCIMKDLRFYNITTRQDFEIEETDAVSFGDGLSLNEI